MRTELEIGRSLLNVSIQYKHWPGEPMVMYYKDGSGYPGSPDEYELISVLVHQWIVRDELRIRDEYWVWNELDQIAYDRIDDDWSEYEEELATKESEDRQRWI